MAEYKLGFIGTGNMGTALAKAVCKAVKSSTVILSNRTALKAQTLADELHCSYGDNKTVASTSQYIFLGVKPQMMKSVLEEISPVLKNRSDRFILIPMAAGIKIQKYIDILNTNYPIIRIMPNTPCSIGKGMIVYSPTENVFQEEISEFTEALKYSGKTNKIDEKLIDAASAVSGCGPAFVYMFAEAMADAGVECGLTRDKAIEYSAQTIAGAAELIIESGKHPAKLKDEVCSPGGTTICGVHSLEGNSFRGTVMSAVLSAYKKTIDLSK